MPGKLDALRRIDRDRGTVGDAGELYTSTAASAGPAVPTVPPPVNLQVVGNVLLLSAQAPRALVSLTWNAGGGGDARLYEVQIATDSAFTTGILYFRAGQPSAAIELITSAAGIAYWARVRIASGQVFSDWSSSVSFTSAADTTPPSAPSSVTASFIGAGDLEILWANGTGSSFRDTEVSIYGDSGFTVLLYQVYSTAGRVLWTAAQNRAAGSGTPDPSLFVRLRSRSWGGAFSSYVSPASQPTKAVPATPGSVTQSWSGDTGAAGPDLSFSWGAVSGALFYRLTLDGVARDLTATRYTYTLDTNRSEHSGTPDPVITYSLVAVDALDQTSAAASGTATNAAPAAPSSATLTAFFSTLTITVGSALPADGSVYRYRLIQTLPSAADVTWDSSSGVVQRPISVNATYQVGVKAVDVFGQASTETLSGTLATDALTISDLRADAIYSDSASTSPATLKAALADDNVASGGIVYALAAGWTTWIDCARALTYRHKTVTLAMSPTSGTTSFYLRVSSDGSTWSYYAGPVTGGRTLTAVADAAAAQAAAVDSATLGNPTASRVDLPATVEARFVEVWFRNTAATTTVREFYPRRLVQADDIQVQNLAAISADLGSITAGTITGATIQTSAGNPKVILDSANGLRSFDSGGTLQAQIRTSDGSFVAAGGNVVINSSGVKLSGASSAWGPTNAYQVMNSAGTTNVGGLAGFGGVSSSSVELRSTTLSQSLDANMIVAAYCDSGKIAQTILKSTYSTALNVSQVTLETTGTTSRLNVDADAVELRGPLKPVRSSGTALFAIDGTAQGSAITLANLATSTPFSAVNNFSGLIAIKETAVDGSTALFLTGGGAIALISDPSGHYSAASGTASRTNVYLSSSVVTIENRRGGSRTYNVQSWRLGTTN